MIHYQILQTNITRTIWQTVRRITKWDLGSKRVNSWHPNISMHILHTVLYTFHDRLTSLQTLLEIKRIVFNNQELPKLVIISLMLRTSMSDSGVILWREIKCWSLLQVNPLHPDISIYFLYTLLFTFTLVLTRRIHFTITAS